MGEKEIEEIIERWITRKMQDKNIAKDLKNGRQYIGWKDWGVIAATVLGMFTVIYFSAQANSKANCVEIAQVSHERIDAERYDNINKALTEIKSDIKDMRKEMRAK